MKLGKLSLLILVFASFNINSWASDTASPDVPRPFVEPAKPQSGVDIAAGLFYPSGGCTDGKYKVQRNDRTIVVTHFIEFGTVMDFGTCYLAVSIGALPAGFYVLQWNEQFLPEIIYPGNIYLYTFTTSFQVGSGGPLPIPAITRPGIGALVILIICLGFLRRRSCFRSNDEKVE